LEGESLNHLLPIFALIINLYFLIFKYLSIDVREFSHKRKTIYTLRLSPNLSNEENLPFN